MGMNQGAGFAILLLAALLLIVSSVNNAKVTAQDNGRSSENQALKIASENKRNDITAQKNESAAFAANPAIANKQAGETISSLVNATKNITSKILR
jgi:hypothetical protein